MGFRALEDTMISVSMMTPQEMLKAIATNARKLRLQLDLSQQTLSARSGVSYGSLKKFEQTGQISLESLLKLALILGCIDGFKDLFAPVVPVLSLDDLIKDKSRKRGRK